MLSRQLPWLSLICLVVWNFNIILGQTDEHLFTDLLSRMTSLEHRDLVQANTINQLLTQLGDQSALIERLTTRLDEQTDKLQTQTSTILKQQLMLDTLIHIPDMANHHTTKQANKKLQQQNQHVIGLEASLNPQHDYVNDSEFLNNRSRQAEQKLEDSLAIAKSKEKSQNLKPGYATIRSDPINERRRQLESPVAFHARIDKYSVTHVGINQNIVFDVVLLNLGNGYHSNHGAFISPQAGLYIFSVSIMSLYSDHFNAELVQNGNILAKIGDYAEATSGGDQGSITVVTQLVVGDEVWVRMSWPADASYRGDGFTSFTGILITSM